MNVSVIVATYGDAQWWRLAIARAIPSAWENEPYEVIPRHEDHGTLASARNNAASEATGDWLCFLDADDELAPGYLKAMGQAKVALPDVPRALAGGYLLVPAVEYVNADGTTVGPAIPNEGGWPTVNECVIGTLVYRDLFVSVGGFEDYPIYEDYALFLACDRAGARRLYVRDAVYRAYVRSGSRNVNATYQLTTYNEIRRQDEWARRGR